MAPGAGVAVTADVESRRAGAFDIDHMVVTIEI